MDDVDEFERHRQRLFGIAYRMLGTVSDAEDVLQDAFLRWQSVDATRVSSVRAYLASIVTRLSIDRLRRIQARREDYVGPWLPEPLVHRVEADATERADAISFAMLTVLESLGPVERAVFLLREVFDYDYPEIARVVDRSEANCRKIFQRARLHVSAGEMRFHPTPEHHESVTQRFMEAIGSGDLSQLVSVLQEDITLVSDGGGKVVAARRPLVGAEKVARFLLGIFQKAPPSMRHQFCLVNGSPGILITDAGRLDSIMAWDIASDRITAIYAIRNPDKLGHLDPVV